MKNTARLLALVLALLLLPFSPRAYAEVDGETVRGIYEVLLAENSVYSECKASFLAFDPEMTFEETLTDGGFIISATDNNFYNNSWRFMRDGDDLVSSFAANDIGGILLSVCVINAVGSYYGMDTDHPGGYITLLNALKLDNDDFSIEHDEEKGTATVRIHIAGPYDRKALDGLQLDTPVLDDKALNKRYFRTLAELEFGTAGASLKTARAACHVCGFISDYKLHDPDAGQLRHTMDAAYAMLDEDGQSALWQGFEAVRTLLDACLEDYGANRAVFEDAGVAEEMDSYMDDERVLTGWEKLRDLSESLGNT